MKIKNQVVGLELARQLKKLGVKQDSLYYWHSCLYTDSKRHHNYLNNLNKVPDYPNPSAIQSEEIYSAFTVSELGELLPDAVATYRYETYDDDRDIWACIKYVEGNHEKYEYVVHTKTEANVRAKMLIYLLENKIRNLK